MKHKSDASRLPCRSLLFTPATRPQSFDKALECGADIVCVDLEDAVPPSMKTDARSGAVDFLANGSPGLPRRAVRINPLSTRAGLADLAALADARPRTGLVMVPKVADAAELRLIDAILTEAGSDLRLSALIEGLDGLEVVTQIAQATDRLDLLVFGAVDFSAEMGAENTDTPMLYARSRIVLAAKRAGLDIMDVPDLDFRNTDSIAAAAARARQLGFTGKAAIHPAGIASINRTFTPDADEIAYALRVIAAFEASPNGLAVLDGKLVEAPVVRAMRHRLQLAKTAGVLDAK